MSDRSAAATPEAATKQERVDFLKQVIAFTEGNVRSYDTKAQISLAAFAVSANPLVAIATSGCSASGGKAVLMVLVPAYLATILSYLWAIWPVAPPVAQLTEGLKQQNAFFVLDPLSLGAPSYVERLNKLAVEPELTAEALKLAYIRRVKARRFKTALVATLSTYLLVAIAFFFIGRCF
ncbi:MAG: hypothetical protein JNM89_02475 [Hyphomicrobiaceae bacterium]|nr:hypothetical protein [Hyphomicrobiaceae bacterium]